MKYKTGNTKIKNITLKVLCFLIALYMLTNQLAFCEDTIEEKNGYISKIKLQATLTPPYVIGPGDQLTITDRTLRELFGQVEKFDVVVSGDGYISIPLPNGAQTNILAAGLTLDDLSIEIRSQFGKTLKNPLVFTQISRYRPINVYIGGEIVKPGVYKIETTTTTEKGATTTSSINTFGLSLTQAIQLAGGLKPRADIKNITVTRGSGNEKKIVDLKALLTGENTLQDINLQPGDSIFIKAADNIDDQAQSHVVLLGKLAYQEVPINVVGEVKTAGSFVLPNDATLLDAIGKAGGTNEVGSLKRIRLSRYDNDGTYRTYKINIHDLIHKGVAFDQIALRPNDTIELEASKGKETRHFIHLISPNVISTVLGSVTGAFAGWVVQDNMFPRYARLQKGIIPNIPSNNAITVIGGGK